MPEMTMTGYEPPSTSERASLLRGADGRVRLPWRLAMGFLVAPALLITATGWRSLSVNLSPDTLAVMAAWLVITPAIRNGGKRTHECPRQAYTAMMFGNSLSPWSPGGVPNHCSA
jgi:hypothetical protein